ncbi:MAG: glycosyltransferase family 2 protein, partial [Solobacterium sp.]|nr:glycosyltransferase family 2 protein [Solobacterium sp.]
MNEKEMISVIIPVYNVKDYIDECMESVVHQTYKDLEILLINDGSTDGSHEKCLFWAERDTRIRYINKQNEGVAASRNLGVDLA